MIEDKLILPATIENWEQVHSFISKYLDLKGCSEKVKFQLLVAAEEIYVNIAHYAYKDKVDDSVGMATVELKMPDDIDQTVITFEDNGIQYDPLKKETPDITLTAEQRKIGGLGIHMVRKMMDEVEYKYEDGKNILTIKKG